MTDAIRAPWRPRRGTAPPQRDDRARGHPRPHRDPKTLPPKLFYDAAGAELFERISELPEYYLTRAELEILRARVAARSPRSPVRTPRSSSTAAARA